MKSEKEFKINEIVMVQDTESDGETTFYEYLLKYKDWLFKIDNEWLNN